MWMNDPQGIPGFGCKAKGGCSTEEEASSETSNGGGDTEEEGQESGSGGRDEGWILRDQNWNSCGGRKR